LVATRDRRHQSRGGKAKENMSGGTSRDTRGGKLGGTKEDREGGTKVMQETQNGAQRYRGR